MKAVVVMTVLLILFLNLLMADPLSSGNKLIVVEIKSRTLMLFENGKIIKKFRVRVGRKETPTPIGRGYIYEKRERAIFRYQEGPNKGEIIEWVRLSDGRVVKIPYEKMRALGFKIYGCNTNRYSIHSIVDEATIGKAVSDGCIGMRIKDMLQLYPLVKKGTTEIIIKP